MCPFQDLVSLSPVRGSLSTRGGLEGSDVLRNSAVEAGVWDSTCPRDLRHFTLRSRRGSQAKPSRPWLCDAFGNLRVMGRNAKSHISMGDFRNTWQTLKGNRDFFLTFVSRIQSALRETLLFNPMTQVSRVEMLTPVTFSVDFWRRECTLS